MERLGLLQTRLDRFAESFDVAAKHVGNAQRQLEEAGRRLARLQEAFGELSGPAAEASAVPSVAEPISGVSVDPRDH
jgi:hypothetical protein